MSDLQTQPASSSRTLPASAPSLLLSHNLHPNQSPPTAASRPALCQISEMGILRLVLARLQRTHRLLQTGLARRAAAVGLQDPLVPPPSSCHSPRTSPTCRTGPGETHPCFGCLLPWVSFMSPVCMPGWACAWQTA